MSSSAKIATLGALLLFAACTNQPVRDRVYPKNYREIIAMSKVIEVHGETADSIQLGNDRYLIDNLDYLIANNQKVAVVFSAYWCKDCFKFDPWFNEAATLREYSNILFAHAEVDGTKGNENFRTRFELPGIPVVILFENGQILERNGEKGILFDQDGDKTKEDLLKFLKMFL